MSIAYPPLLKNLGIGTRTLIAGVLNVTPDSFSDGGQFNEPERALKRAFEMVEQGADIIDIGGESTRPSTFNDRSPLSVEEELCRVIPTIQAISRELPKTPISIDTYKADVAERALDAGAGIINDISGLTYDSRMASVTAKHKCPVILMHLLGQPRQILRPFYNDVVEDIIAFFSYQICDALAAGIKSNFIILDPGIGFGKNLEHNLTILRQLKSFKELGYPIMIGPSRKKFIGTLLADAPVEDRLEGTSAAVAIGIANGADIVRVHDIKEIARVARVADAIVRVPSKTGRTLLSDR
jgi:dihydropteroate synthase